MRLPNNYKFSLLMQTQFEKRITGPLAYEIFTKTTIEKGGYFISR